MLKRAYISAVIAAVAAIFGFSGLLNGAEPVAKGICYAFGALTGLSLLFSLFEEVDQPLVQEVQLAPAEPAPQLVFNFAAEQPALTPIPVTVTPMPVSPLPVTPAYAS
jgi:uncharacterized membrane protein YtjA (UPF0391 family)